MKHSRQAFRPFASGGKRTIAAILVTFALIGAASIALSISATEHSKNQATVVQVADRQRMLAERYISDLLLVQAGQQADPATTAHDLARRFPRPRGRPSAPSSSRRSGLSAT